MRIFMKVAAASLVIAPSLFGTAHAINIMSEIEAKANKTQGEYKVEIENRGDAQSGGTITQGAGGIVAQQGHSGGSKIKIEDSEDKSKLDAKILNRGSSSSGGSIMQGAGGQLYQQN